MAKNVAHAMTAPPEPEVMGQREERLLDHLMPAIRATVVTLVLTGLLYPLVMTGIAQGLFRRRAEGSFVTDAAGKVVGSELMAQGFSRPGYFQPRPSAAGEKGYDPLASGGSNLGPTSKKLHDQAAAALERLQKENPEAAGAVPIELVTASGAGSIRTSRRWRRSGKLRAWHVRAAYRSIGCARSSTSTRNVATSASSVSRA
jgi:K+-transporting ATPase KdpC subunit